MGEERIRIEFLDGIRGASALFVVVFHALLFTQRGIVLSDNAIVSAFQNIASVGHISVSIFIVLSGFCLGIPVVTNNLELKGGFSRYIKRRGNRILFPYYVALLFSILIYFLFPVLQTVSGTAWDGKIPLTTESVVAHLLLVHNLKYDWIYKINGAHWSVATEWHIYFLFPVMLYVWRRFNLYISLLFFAALTVGLYLIIPFAEPQFILLFFFGVISAYLSFGLKKRYFSKWLYYVCLIGFVPVTLCVFFKFPAKIIYQLMFGLNFSLLLYLLVGMVRSAQNSLVIDFFASSPLMRLGKVSYSLYLIHGPILALANLSIMNHLDLSYDSHLFITWFVVVPICVLLSAVFFHFVESKFLNK